MTTEINTYTNLASNTDFGTISANYGLKTNLTQDNTNAYLSTTSTGKSFSQTTDNQVYQFNIQWSDFPSSVVSMKGSSIQIQVNGNYTMHAGRYAWFGCSIKTTTNPEWTKIYEVLETSSNLTKTLTWSGDYTNITDIAWTLELCKYASSDLPLTIKMSDLSLTVEETVQEPGDDDDDSDSDSDNDTDSDTDTDTDTDSDTDVDTDTDIDEDDDLDEDSDTDIDSDADSDEDDDLDNDTDEDDDTDDDLVEPFELPYPNWYDPNTGRVYKDILIKNFNAIEAKIKELDSINLSSFTKPDISSVVYPDVDLTTQDDTSILNLKSFLNIVNIINYPLIVQTDGNNKVTRVEYWGSDYVYHKITNTTVKADDDYPFIYLDYDNKQIIHSNAIVPPTNCVLVGLFKNNKLYTNNNSVLANIDFVDILCNQKRKGFSVDLNPTNKGGGTSNNWDAYTVNGQTVAASKWHKNNLGRKHLEGHTMFIEGSGS